MRAALTVALGFWGGVASAAVHSNLSSAAGAAGMVAAFVWGALTAALLGWVGLRLLTHHAVRALADRLITRHTGGAR